MAHILIIDDEPDLCELVRVILEVDGHSVAVAGDGHSGLVALVDRQIQLVILDLMMPGLSGTDMLIKLDGSVPVIVLTAVPHSSAHDQARSLGAARVLTKPFRVPELVAAIHEVLAESGGRSE